MIDHVTVEIGPSPGVLAACVEFYGALGYVRRDGGTEVGAVWLEGGGEGGSCGAMIHLIREGGPRARGLGGVVWAHLAIVVGSERFSGLLCSGVIELATPRWGGRRAWAWDPAGNRVEVMERGIERKFS